MKRRKYQANDERTVLTGMIVNDEVLDTIARNLKGSRSPFRSKWSNLIGRWCLEYWEKYKRAPRGRIQNRFVRFAEANQDKDAVDLVESFLAGLSDDLKGLGEEMNAQFVIDTASRYFNEVKLEGLSKSINRALESKDVDAATEAYHEFEPIEFVAGSDPNPFSRAHQKKHLAHKENQTLIKFPKALGEFLGSSFERDSFVAFAGPEKRGKSFWLMEVVWQALRNRRRVLYVITGDMSENQAMLRFYSRASRQPRRSMGSISVPTRILQKDKKILVRRKSVDREGLTFKVVSQAMDALMVKTAANEPRLKTKIYESSTISAADIESHIGELAKKDWVPDVVVIDYADILLAEPHAKHLEYRHQVNETWKTLRRISQRFHLCLVTATQTAATSYDKDIIRKSDFSEDKRKAAHVTGMLGINQTPDEKKMGLYRLNWVFLRDGHWSDNQVVHTAGNLLIANPCIISSLF